jgi:Low-density lipoprotein receptor repeat class B
LCRDAGAAALMWLLLGALMPLGAQAKVYFTAFLAGGGTGIERAGLEGAGLETLQSQPAGFEDDLALDVPDGKMYWTDSDASVIWSSNLNGSDPRIVLDDFGAEPLGIALDVAGGKMYWTDSEGVKRASLEGTEEELLSKEPARGFIALDLVTKRMYWADYKSGDIKTAAMAPGASVTNLITKQTSAFGIAVDPTAGKVYWLDLNLEKRKNENDEIRRANLDGSEVQTLLERPGAGFEGGLAIEPAAGKLYWTEAETHDVAVSNLDGSEAETLFSTGEDIPEGLAVETADPHPTNTLAPSIEGSAQVGSQLSCNPGAWTSTGPVSFAYQWTIVGGSGVEGAADGTYVPSSEQADEQLQCVVTAADNVGTSTAASAAVSVAALPSTPTLEEATPVEAPLIAGIAFARSTVSGTTAHVAVFTSLAATATLIATPARKLSRHGVTSRRARAPRRVTSRTRSESGRKPKSMTVKPKTITVRQGIAVGRDTITLHKLTPGTTYRLVLTVTSSGGQVAKDTATLIVAAR